MSSTVSTVVPLGVSTGTYYRDLILGPSADAPAAVMAPVANPFVGTRPPHTPPLTASSGGSILSLSSLGIMPPRPPPVSAGERVSLAGSATVVHLDPPAPPAAAATRPRKPVVVLDHGPKQPSPPSPAVPPPPRGSQGTDQLAVVLGALMSQASLGELRRWVGQDFQRYVVAHCRPDELLAWSGPLLMNYLVALGWKPPTEFGGVPPPPVGDDGTTRDLVTSSSSTKPRHRRRKAVQAPATPAAATAPVAARGVPALQVPTRGDLEAMGGVWAYSHSREVGRVAIPEGAAVGVVPLGLMETNGSFSAVRWPYGQGVWYGGTDRPTLELTARAHVSFDVAAEGFPPNVDVLVTLGHYVGGSATYDQRTPWETLAFPWAAGARATGPLEVSHRVTLPDVAADTTLGLWVSCNASRVTLALHNVEVLIRRVEGGHAPPTPHGAWGAM